MKLYEVKHYKRFMIYWGKKMLKKKWRFDPVGIMLEITEFISLNSFTLETVNAKRLIKHKRSYIWCCVFSLSIAQLPRVVCVFVWGRWWGVREGGREGGRWGRRQETNKSLKLSQICMEGAEACHLFTAVPSPADLICMCMAQRTIAELRAWQLQRAAQCTYCLACRCLRSHAAPSAASCRWGSARAEPGGARGLSLSTARRGTRVGSGWFGPVVERRGGVSSGVLPAAVGTIIYSQTLSETLVNRPQRREISCVFVCLCAAADTCSAPHKSNLHHASVLTTLLIFS